MTVKDLINKLNEYGDHLEVYIYCANCDKEAYYDMYKPVLGCNDEDYDDKEFPERIVVIS